MSQYLVSMRAIPLIYGGLGETVANLQSRRTTSPEQAKANLAHITHAANVLASSAEDSKTINNQRKEKPMNQKNKPRTHLFSPHTDQCIYCGKSAEDDAIENTSCGSDQPVTCGACGGKGWLWCIAEGDHPSGEEIQRCDGTPTSTRLSAVWAKTTCIAHSRSHPLPVFFGLQRLGIVSRAQAPARAGR